MIFHNNVVFVTSKLFQPSLMFVGKPSSLISMQGTHLPTPSTVLSLISPPAGGFEPSNLGFGVDCSTIALQCLL
jgi:hypothetical protein